MPCPSSVDPWLIRIERGRAIRDGVVFDVKNWTHNMTDADSLIDAVQDLFALLEEREIDYLLVGGVPSSTMWKGRNTQDLELTSSIAHIPRAPACPPNCSDPSRAAARLFCYNGLYKMQDVCP
jgi:hypothetical protein